MGDDNTSTNRTILIIVSLVLGLLMFAGLGAMFLFRAGDEISLTSSRMPMILIAVLVVLIAVVFGILTVWRQNQQKSEKSKRLPDGMDMYSVVDRMVEDLDEDEVDYLRRRIKAARSGKTAEVLGTLLDEREDARSEGRR